MIKCGFSLVILSLLMSACMHRMADDNDTILAKVHDDYLYESDLAHLLTQNLSPRDSIVLVHSFVNNWVKTMLVIHQAEKNLTSEQLDFEQRLEQYRQSLIIYEYETELVRQQLDTVVDEPEIQKYYESHLLDFELKENIAKVMYVILDEDSPEEEHFVDLFSLPDSLVLDSLELYSKLYARSYFLDTANWIRFNDLLELIPIETFNQELYLMNRQLVHLADEDNIYLLRFVAHKIKDETSPLEYEREDIRNIIINKRKMQLVKMMREEIYQKALHNNEFEIYYHE